MNSNVLGILERVLIHRYGQPDRTSAEGMRAMIWAADTVFASVLYYAVDWTRPPASEFRQHEQLYGACCGGMLVGDSLKVAMVSSEKLFGIYDIGTLVAQPEVKRAMALDAEVEFFMDAANVWYYGHKCGRLFVYDAPSDELDDLGPLESALDEVIAEWQTAKPAT